MAHSITHSRDSKQSFVRFNGKTLVHFDFGSRLIKIDNHGLETRGAIDAMNWFLGRHGIPFRIVKRIGKVLLNRGEEFYECPNELEMTENEVVFHKPVV